MGDVIHRRLRLRIVTDNCSELALPSRRLHGQQRSEHARRERAARRYGRHEASYLSSAMAQLSIDEGRGRHVRREGYVLHMH